METSSPQRRRGPWRSTRSGPARSGSRHGRSCSSARRSTPGSATRSRSDAGNCRGCRVEKDYRLETDDGEKSLAELFDGRSQLLVYHFMFGPSYQAGCPVNSSIADSIDGVVPHLHARDATLLLVSQAPLEKLQAYKRRMGWSIPWVSSSPSDFNFDLGFSQTEEQSREAVAQISALAVPGGRRLDGRVPADRRAERPLDGHRHRRLPHREPGVQHVRPGRRRRLPRVLDDVARIGVRHDLLPDPRPRPEGARRG